MVNLHKEKKSASGFPGEKEVVSKVWELAEPLVVTSGMELCHVEYLPEPGGKVIRLFIDKPGGVCIDDCADVSRELGDLIDVSFPEEFSYRLEVSSPGEERPVSRITDFERFAGLPVRIRFLPAQESADAGKPFGKKRKRKTVKGILEGVFNGNIGIKREDGRMLIPFDQIVNARLMNPNGE